MRHGRKCFFQAEPSKSASIFSHLWSLSVNIKSRTLVIVGNHGWLRFVMERGTKRNQSWFLTMNPSWFVYLKIISYLIYILYFNLYFWFLFNNYYVHASNPYRRRSTHFSTIYYCFSTYLPCKEVVCFHDSCRSVALRLKKVGIEGPVLIQPFYDRWATDLQLTSQIKTITLLYNDCFN